MTYNPNVPLANQKIKDTQNPIQTNFALANTYFGVDHYAFDAASNNGVHNQVTTPEIDGSAHPSTSGSELKFYAMDAGDSNNTLLHFSRGASDSPPTPVTSISNTNFISVAAGSATTVFDFSGMPNAYGFAWAMNDDAAISLYAQCVFFWFNPNVLKITDTHSFNTRLQFAVNGNRLQLGSILGGGGAPTVYYTLSFGRIFI